MCDLKADRGDVGSCGWQHLRDNGSGRRESNYKEQGWLPARWGARIPLPGCGLRAAAGTCKNDSKAGPEVACRKATKLTWVFG